MVKTLLFQTPVTPAGNEPVKVAPVAKVVVRRIVGNGDKLKQTA